MIVRRSGSSPRQGAWRIQYRRSGYPTFQVLRAGLVMAEPSVLPGLLGWLAPVPVTFQPRRPADLRAATSRAESGLPCDAPRLDRHRPKPGLVSVAASPSRPESAASTRPAAKARLAGGEDCLSISAPFHSPRYGRRLLGRLRATGHASVFACWQPPKWDSTAITAVGRPGRRPDVTWRPVCSCIWA